MPNFDINSFMANYSNGARQYLFYILLDNPMGSLGMDRTSYLVRSSSIPEWTIEPITTNWQGNEYKQGSTHTFGDWTVEFNVDARSKVHDDFEAWQSLIHDPTSNMHGDPLSYMRNQTIQLLDGFGDKIKERTLIAAWPSTVGEIALDYGTKDVANFSVTFSYQYYV